ncbi:hypothetical protein ACFQH3_18545 [Haladaptatus sp. GCM10025707]|uniref:hypothetical protein n=1 Tax=unclassified Haladaptatus TaxID=2622732 RepID=UPI0023E830EC|nr:MULTISPECIES: hypothetical protein [unclassified Haladaptatus]
MKRRPLLHSLAAGSALLSAGCVDSVPFVTGPPKSDDVFSSYRFEGADLVVEFREDVIVEEVVFYDEDTDEEHETVSHPGETARFRVIFPETFETRLTGMPHVKAKTADGWTSEWAFGSVHAWTNHVEALPDGRARFDIQNQGDSPLLIRFVAISGDVPNPTVDPQSESFDRSSLGFDPGVIGVGANQPLTPDRPDLIVPGGETRAFETTYAPFAFPDGAPANACDGAERTGKVTVVHGRGGSAAYSFDYRLTGAQSSVNGGGAVACSLESNTA